MIWSAADRRTSRDIGYAILRDPGEWPPDILASCLETDRMLQAWQRRAVYRRLRKVAAS